VTSLREGDKQIPVIAKLRMEERATLSDLENLYIGSSQGTQKVPISEIASLHTEMRPEKLRRRKQFRTITVSAFPAEGYLPVAGSRDARHQGDGEDAPTRLSHRDRRRIRGAAEGF
jgi:multidrug efflux pump subunit AcrB